MPLCLCLLLSIFIHNSSSAQTTAVSGTILDAETGEPMAFATVVFTGTTIGVTSDFNGLSISCTGGNDGRVKVTNSGGTAPYTYLWDDTGATTIDSLDGVVAGIYNVTVTDFNLCTTIGSIEIFDPTPVVAEGADEIDF